MKRILPLFLLLPLLLSCAPTARYAALPVDALSEVALDALDGEEYLLDTVGITDDYFSMPDYVESHAIFYCKRTECIDEIGLFHVESGHAEELAALLRTAYLSPAYEKNRDFYDSYIPKETPKLRDARVECYGDTVVYAILSPSEQTTLFAALKKALTE